MSPRPKHASPPSNLREHIIAAAWEQITAKGAPALSLRAIARALNITAPAIYNYFADRDELVTALIIEAYTSLGDSQFAARDAVPAGDLVGRLKATGTAYRQWALAYPQRYQLVFGTPIPGYVAPFEQTSPSASRSLGALVSVVEALRTAGRLRVSEIPQVATGGENSFGSWKNDEGEAHILSLSISVLIWSRVHGLVSIEIGNRLPPFGLNGDALYQYEMQALVEQFVQ